MSQRHMKEIDIKTVQEMIHMTDEKTCTERVKKKKKCFTYILQL